MRKLLEKIREKPEGVRKSFAVIFFCAIGGIIFFIWYWNISGRPADRGPAKLLNEVKQTATNGFQSFQNFRTRLGELKHTFNEMLKTNTIPDALFNSFSSYESENADEKKSKEEPPASDIPPENTP